MGSWHFGKILTYVKVDGIDYEIVQLILFIKKRNCSIDMNIMLVACQVFDKLPI